MMRVACTVGCALLGLWPLACDREGPVHDEDTNRSPIVDRGSPEVERTAAQGVGTTPALSGTRPEGSNQNQGDRLTDREAEAEFKSAAGFEVEGEAELEESPEGVRISVNIEGAPKGLKGLHIHQTDDCSNIPAKSMGGHFAPDGEKHGMPNDTQHHLGDLGNISIDAEGNGKLEITVPEANLREGDHKSFIGKAIVLHEGKDTGAGEAGEAGKPIACAPIKKS